MKLRLPEHLRDRARCVAQHEMGHYVIARAMGFRTGNVSLEITGPFDGHRGTATITLPEPAATIEEVRAYLERRVIVLFAGAAAETLPPRGAPSKKVNAERAVEIIKNPGQGAEQDYAKVRELINLLRNIVHDATDIGDNTAIADELKALDLKLFSRTVDLVELYADTIIGLGGNLADRVKFVKEMVTISASELEKLPAVQEITKIPTFEEEGV